MPLSEERKRQLLAEQGLDPARYRVVDDVDEVTPEPSLSPPITTAAPPKTSALPAFGRAALSSVAPTLGGLGAGALAYGIAAPLAPATGGLSLAVPLLASLGASILGGIGTAKVQEALLPEAANQQLATDIQEHPIATAVGGFAPSLAAFNPIRSAQQLGALGARIPSMIRYGGNEVAAMTVPQIQAAKNLALNTGINLGTAGAQAGFEEYRNPEPFSLSRFAARTLPAALLNAPTRLGQRVFRFPDTGEALLGRGEITPATPEAGLAPPVTGRPDYVPGGDYFGPGVPLYPKVKQFGESVMVKETPSGKPTLTKRVPAKSAEESAQAIAEAEKRAVREAKEAELEPKMRPYRAAYSEESKLTPEQQARVEGLSRLDVEEAQRRGIGLETSKEKVPGSTGKPILGKYELPQRKATLYEGEAVLGETAGHEVGHGFINDLLRSQNPRDRLLGQKAKQFFKEHEINREEGVAEVLGVDSFRRKMLELEGNARDKFVDWYKDATASFKYKMGTAGREETTRHLAMRQRHDVPYGQRPELLPTATERLAPRAAGVTQPRYSEETKLKQELPPTSQIESQKLTPPSEPVKPKQTESVITEPTKGLKEAPVVYRGYQEGFGKIPGMHLYNLTETISPKLVKDSTVTEKSLNEAGFSVPESARPKAAEGAKHSEESMLQPEDINLDRSYGHWISPSGEMLRVSSHELGALTLLSRLKRTGQITSEEFKKYTEGPGTHLADQYLYQKGWARGVHEEADKYYVNSEHPLTGAQRRRIKDYGIERNSDASWESYSQLGGKLEKIYSKSEGERFSEESKLPEHERILTPEEKADLPKDIESAKEFGDINKPEYYGGLRERPTKEQRRKEETVERSITNKLQEGQTEARNKALEAYTQAKEGKEIEAEREGRPIETSFGPEVSEPLIEAASKAEEVRTFTRPDVERHSEESKLPPPDQQRYSFFKPMAAAVDKVRNVDPKVAEAANRYFTQRDIYEGKFRHAPFEEAAKLSPKERANVLEFIRDKFRETKLGKTVTAREQSLVDKIMRPWSQNIAKLEDQAGMPIYTKFGKVGTRKISDYHIPDMLSDETLQKLTTGSASQTRQIIDDWATYVSKQSKGEIPFVEARDNISSLVSGLTGDDLYSVEFPQFRKAQKYEIPESLREKELLKIVQKYGRRSAQDLAFWKHLQSDPHVAAALRLPKAEGGGPATKEGVTPISNNKDVQSLMKFVYNDFSAKSNPRITAVMRAVGNALLGAGTGLRDVAQVPVFAVPYMRKFSDLGTFFKAFNGLREAKKASLEYGARSGTMDLDRWRTLESPDQFTGFFNKTAEAMRKYQGRDLLEQGARIYAFNIGKELAKVNVIRAVKGDKTAQKWLKDFGTLKEKEVSAPKMDLLDDSDFMNTLAKNFVDRHQGTYDARGLPAGAFEGPLAPFFALSRWSVEKSNVIYKDVIKPALSGESFVPLLTYTLGSVLTGEAIRELNTLMSGKKSAEPTGKESLDKKRLDYYLANVVNLMQLGSFAGIMSDGAKVITDLGISHERPRGASFPLVNFATDTVGQGIQDYFSAVDQGADKMDAATGLIQQILKSSIQNYRLTSNRLDPEETGRINKFRDIRVFKKLEGREAVPSLAELRTNPLLRAEERKFKRTTDLGEAASLAPELVSETFQKYGRTGDIEGLRSRLRGLKINSYQTVPNPETKPQEFGRFVKFIRETQGPEALRETLVDYFSQKQRNRLKSSLIPAIQ